MGVPVFEGVGRARGRGRPGRVLRRCRGASALVVVAVLGAGQAAPAVATVHGPPLPGAPAGGETAETPQGLPGALFGGPGGVPGPPRSPRTTRAEIIKRAKRWVAAKVPYRVDAYWRDGYRQDCSGFVSMAWKLGANEWTGSLAALGVRVSKAKLQPGDILLFHNRANPRKGSHAVVFGGWTNRAHTSYTAYEQTPPATRRRSTPYRYWNNSARYVPYRYKYVVASKSAENGGE
ncbi:hypothetical protein [Streptomyces macrolidinus]|uniref:hypothetical protein n=1 Tax=Streptomyces macrolidinus TaxID=2952607 RepID=UPI0035576747